MSMGLRLAVLRATGAPLSSFATDNLRLFLRIALRTIFASLARAHERVHIQNIYKMIAFSKRFGLQETNHRFYAETSTWA